MLYRTTADSNQNSVENSNEISSSRKTSYCDNDKGCLPNDNEEDPVGSVWELQLGDLQWVGTLGVGGFGRVELVTAGNNNNHAFALKKMKKAEVSTDMLKNFWTILYINLLFKLGQYFLDKQYVED